MIVTSESLRRDIACADAVTWLRTLAPASVDMVCTDPAYESLEKWRAIGTTTRLTGSWFEIFPNARLPELLTECYRVLKKDTHARILCDWPTALVITPMAEAVGFTAWQPWVWDKVNQGMGYHGRARYELILYLEKGKRKLNDLGMPNLLVHKKVSGGYPTEKPTGLLRDLIAQSTAPGDLVADPFMGSGASGVAALQTGRRIVGCELDMTACLLARARLADWRSEPYDTTAIPKPRPKKQKAQQAT